MVNTTLTKLFKSVIIKEDLIDTGRLLNSIVVFTNVSDTGAIVINVDCEDYIKYHLVDYRIINQFTNNNIFELEIEDMIAPIIESSIQDIVDNPSLETTNINPSVIILVNGR